ncbi:MAG: hypothetical protein R3B72_40640 [Polyangiaceae bacterium]
MIELEDQQGEQRIRIGTPSKETYLKLGFSEDDLENIVFSTSGSKGIYSNKWKIRIGDEGINEASVGDVVESYQGSQTTFVTKRRLLQALNINEWAGSRFEIKAGLGLEIEAGATMSVTAPIAEYAHGASVTMKYGRISLDGGVTGIALGATTGTVGSINLTVPGGVIIDAPNWKVSAPTVDWSGVFKCDAVATKLAFTAASADYTIRKATAASTYMSVVGTKYDWCGQKLANEAQEIKQSAVSDAIAGAMVRVAALVNYV